MKDGQVLNDEGTVFNMQLAPDDGWELYEPKKEVKTFDKNKALGELMNGKKIKAISWDDNYIYVDNKGQIVDQDGNAFNFMAEKEDKWTYFIEKEEDIKNKALMNEIHRLTKMIEDLAKQKEQKVAVDKNCIGKADREEMEQFFYGVTGSEVKEQFKSELERVYYVDMRNIIKDVLAESSYLDTALDLFTIPSEVHDEVKKAEAKRVIQKINDC